MFTVSVIEKGGKKTKTFIDAVLATVGRIQGNDIVLPLGNVSKKHCKITQKDSGFEITDFGSTNGTYVNGRKIKDTVQIEEGDQVYIGEFIITLEKAEQEQEDSGLKPRIKPPPSPRPKERNSSFPPPVEQAAPDSSTDLLGTKFELPKPSVDSSQCLNKKISSPPLEMGNIQKLIDYVSLEVKAIDPVNLPTMVDLKTAEKIRILIKGMVSEMSNENLLDKDVSPEKLMLQVFSSIIDMGPLSDLLFRKEIKKIAIYGPDEIWIYTESTKEKLSLKFESAAFLGHVIACLGASLPGGDSTYNKDLKFRIETGELVLAKLQPLASVPYVVIYKDISVCKGEIFQPRLLMQQDKKTIVQALENRESILVIGESLSCRLKIMCELTHMISEEKICIAIEDAPLLGFNSSSRIGLCPVGLLPEKVRDEFQNMLLTASDIDSDWLIIRGSKLSEFNYIVDLCLSRKAVIAELPAFDLRSIDLFENNLNSEEFSKKTSISFWKDAFDLVIVGKETDMSTVSIEQIMKLGKNN